jgi:2-polyprenyl-3-methyl-5-hydroxy-6-metoxy-1,4-benzoquinol methylase
MSAPVTTLWDDKMDGRAVEADRPWYASALELVAAMAPDSADVVEVGCGNGEFATRLKKTGKVASYVGLDGYAPSLEAAGQAGHDVRQANFEEPLELTDASADLVVSLEVIEHVAKAEQMLSSMRRILRPNGLLVLSTPNVGFAVARLRYLTKAEVGLEGIHLRFFNKDRLEQLASDAGLRVVRRASFMPALGYNTLARQWGGARRMLACPEPMESWLALHFVWALGPA